MAVGSRFFLRDFDGGQTLSNRQEFRLGTIGQDEIGQEWSYVCFQRDTYNVGEWVQDSGQVAVTAAHTPDNVVRDGFIIERTGGTTAFPDKLSTVGAIGIVTAGGAKGDTFAITEWLKAGKVRVRTLGGPRWSAGFDQNTALVYRLPGLLKEADRNAGFAARGVIQRDIEDDDLPDDTTLQNYGWVLQKGIGRVAIPAGTISSGSLLYTAANARFSSTEAQAPVGRVLAARTGAGAAGDLIVAEVFIENNAVAPSGMPPLTGVGMRGEVIR